MDVQGTISFWLIIITLGIPITHVAMGYITKTPQQNTRVQKHAILAHPPNPPLHATNTYGIFLTKTWVLTQPINIPIDPTNHVNNIEIILL